VLASAKTGSQQDAQRSLAADGQAKASVAASRAGLAAARQQLTVLNTQIAEATAAVSAAKADLDTAELDLGFTQIRSPIDGLVGNRLAQVGTYVSPGSYLLTIVPQTGLWVDANFKEDQLRSMTNGQAATVYTDIAPDSAQGPCQQPGTGDRGDLQRDPGAERDRQFHQDRAARSRPDHHRPGPGKQGRVAARPVDRRDRRYRVALRTPCLSAPSRNPSSSASCRSW